LGIKWFFPEIGKVADLTVWGLIMFGEGEMDAKIDP